MNIIKTVGGLKKALSVYNDDLILEFVTDDCQVLHLKTDLQITAVDAAEEGVFLEVTLLSK